jgi:hypothetical protein
MISGLVGIPNGFPNPLMMQILNVARWNLSAMEYFVTASASSESREQIWSNGLNHRIHSTFDPISSLEREFSTSTLNPDEAQHSQMWE